MTIPPASPSDPGGGQDRLASPSSERNLQPIREALAERLIGRGHLLEIGSGSGYHAAHLAEAFPGWTWLPSDREAEHRASVQAWARHLGVDLAAPLTLDMLEDWGAICRDAGITPLDAVFSANVIHIAPWTVAEGLVAGAGRVLKPEGLLLLYGPFREGGKHTGDGNARFDHSLRQRDSSWGIRDIEAVADLATASGFAMADLVVMPANNRLAVFRRS